MPGKPLRSVSGKDVKARRPWCPQPRGVTPVDRRRQVRQTRLQAQGARDLLSRLGRGRLPPLGPARLIPARGSLGWWEPAINLLGWGFLRVAAVADYVEHATGSSAGPAAANSATSSGAACFLACALATVLTGHTSESPRLRRLRDRCTTSSGSSDTYEMTGTASEAGGRFCGGCLGHRSGAPAGVLHVATAARAPMGPI